jgi:hypothetical protein
MAKDAKQEPTQRELSEAAADKLRDAAKWLVGAFAAVGAALIAGSQLSSIGKLTVCPHFTVQCTRIWWAIGGAVLGLASVVWAIWIAVDLLIPDALPPSRLHDEWKRGRQSPLRRFFDDNPTYFQGFSSFEEITTKEREAYGRFDVLSRRVDRAPPAQRERLIREMEAVRKELDGLLSRGEAAVSLGNQVAYTAKFRSTALHRMLGAAALAALGIGIFAWAANPPTPPTLASASLRGADLSGADLGGVNLRRADLSSANLTNVDLTDADLEGATLKAARLSGVTWANTICPDGANSDDVGGSCLNHLVPTE